MRIFSPALAFRVLLGPWIALPAATLEGANLVQRHYPYLGEGGWTVDWLAIPLWIIGVISSGVVAIDVARLLRPGAQHLVLAVKHKRRILLWATAWTGGPLLVVHTVALVGALVAGAVDDPSVGWGQLLAAYGVQCLGLLWFVALGSLLGRVVPPLLAGPAGAGLAFAGVVALSGASDGSPKFRLLNFGGATISLIGKQWNLTYLSVQALLLLGSGVFAGLVVPRIRRGRLTLRFPALLTLAVIGAIIVSASQWGPAGARTVAGSAEPPTDCRGHAPVVCVYHEHRRDAAVITSTIARLESSAARAGYTALVFARVEESSRTYSPSGRGVRGFPHPASLEDTGKLDPEELANALVEPGECPQLHDPYGGPPESYWLRLASVVATWLRLANFDSMPARAGDPERITDKLSAHQVASILHDFSRCQLAGTV